MSMPLVKVENISKKFCRDLRRSLWYGVIDLSSELLGRNQRHDELRKDEFWALKGISFHVDAGETLGLIGHNGAGKTTMLRMLNGLMKPDTGRMEVTGRLQALIALGAGFNPVLTGRENIYVNASVLGLTKAEIDRRFDEIVDFSGIEEFIDMPVQSYSSGMMVRLGFSVAANLEPDILLVDEVLSVGDLAFRTKCQVRIQELKRNGVAIIFVSHDLHTVSHLCTRAITFEKGKIIYDGDTEQAIDVYRSSLVKSNEIEADKLRAGTGEISILTLDILNKVGEVQNEFGVGEYVKIRLHYKADELVENPVINIPIRVLNGFPVTGMRTDVDGLISGSLDGEGYIYLIIPNLNLLPNIYTLDAILFHQDGYAYYDRVNNIAHIKVRGGLDVNGTTYLPHTWILDEKVNRVTLPDHSITWKGSNE